MYFLLIRQKFNLKVNIFWAKLEKILYFLFIRLKELKLFGRELKKLYFFFIRPQELKLLAKPRKNQYFFFIHHQELKLLSENL